MEASLAGVDTDGMILSLVQLDNFGADVKYYMLPDVVKELKDSATRHRVQTFPYKIHDRQVSDDALRAGRRFRWWKCLLVDALLLLAVSDFARKTGDIATLSATDLRVLALTYMLVSCVSILVCVLVLDLIAVCACAVRCAGEGAQQRSGSSANRAGSSLSCS